MMRLVLRLLFLLGLTVPACLAARAETLHSVDPDSGLSSWSWQDKDIGFTFNQRLPEQTQAFFEARGFAPQHARQLADDCVFQAVIRTRSTAAAAIRLELAEWRVIPAGGMPQPLHLEPYWQTLWEQLDVEPAARVALRWSLYPAATKLQPGDWNMGMVAFGLTPGRRFDLQLSWHLQNGQTEQAFISEIKDLQCAGAPGQK